MVYIVNDGGQIVSSRSRDNNLAGTSLDMSGCFLFGGVETGTLQNSVNTDLAPGKLRSVSHSIDLDLFSINGDGVLASLYGISQSVFTLR